MFYDHFSARSLLAKLGRDVYMEESRIMIHIQMCNKLQFVIDIVAKTLHFVITKKYIVITLYIL